jgi:hypothetical protein
VWIEKCDWVLSYIEFARKKLKMKNNYEARCQLSMEALACSIDHLDVIMFYTIHAKTMEACTNYGGMGAWLGKC